MRTTDFNHVGPELESWWETIQEGPHVFGAAKSADKSFTRTSPCNAFGSPTLRSMP